MTDKVGYEKARRKVYDNAHEFDPIHSCDYYLECNCGKNCTREIMAEGSNLECAVFHMAEIEALAIAEVKEIIRCMGNDIDGNEWERTPIATLKELLLRIKKAKMEGV